MRFTLVALLSFGVLSGCSVAGDEEQKDSGLKLGQNNVTISANRQDPQFNVVNYAQSEKPHTQVEKDFVFTNMSLRQFTVDQYSFTAALCAEGQSSYSLYLIYGDQVEQLKVNTPFTASTGDRIRVVLFNPAECQSLNYRFSVIQNN